MSNPSSLLDGDGLSQDIIVQSNGTARLKAAGRTITAAGTTDDSASQMIEPVTPTTGTIATVAGSATSVTLLASNVLRLGATIVNDSSALLYVKLAASAASTTSYTVVLAGAASAPFAYYEVPFGFTGEIRGIWASATGNARVGEYV